MGVDRRKHSGASSMLPEATRQLDTVNGSFVETIGKQLNSPRGAPRAVAFLAASSRLNPVFTAKDAKDAKEKNYRRVRRGKQSKRFIDQVRS